MYNSSIRFRERRIVRNILLDKYDEKYHDSETIISIENECVGMRKTTSFVANVSLNDMCVQCLHA